MKNMKNTRTLALLLLVAAAGNSAQAQAQARRMQAGVQYTINSVAEATGTGISYQWYRDGQPIYDTNRASYTIPASEAYGENVEFKRRVKIAGCPGDMVFSNAVYFSFYNLLVNGLRWADTNVDDFQTFAPRPDMYTKFYQWNRATAWSVTDATVDGWNTTGDSSKTWIINPCPAGWRVPAQVELQEMHNTGSTYAAADERGNAVVGRFYGPKNATCTLPDSMSRCIFIPACGSRSSAGALINAGRGNYWSSTQHNVTTRSVYVLNFSTTASTPLVFYNKESGFSVRCVQ